VAGIEETSLRALAKLEQVLPARLRRRVAALQTYTVPVPDTGPSVDPAVLTLLVGACRDRECLRFDYQDHAGVARRRSVEPHRLVSWGRRWYLVAWDAERRDWRTFRVDRLRPLPPLGPRFAPRAPPAEDLAAYVSRGVAVAAWAVRARVLLHAPAAALSERLWPVYGVLEPRDERTCYLDIGSDTLPALAVLIGLLDVDFEVREPPELVAYLRTLAGRFRRSTRGAPRRPSGRPA
jgi:predicted DNA-binding transcriptional regulator YafY